MTAADPWASEAERARDRGIASALDRPAAGQDRQVIDQAIRHLAGTGRDFSAADLRELLPAVAGSLIGARILAAARGGRIERVGSTTTRHAKGHARRISIWRGTGALSLTMPRPAARPSSDPPSPSDPQGGVNSAATPSHERPRAARETTDQKAARLLTEGRVTVERADDDTGLLLAGVVGDHGRHRVIRQPTGRWSCNCEAGSYGRDCSHVAAVQLVAGQMP